MVDVEKAEDQTLLPEIDKGSPSPKRSWRMRAKKNKDQGRQTGGKQRKGKAR